jgi:catechol 2,3-dioxygenase-like lactoylglutathione lyase family enzyme
MVSVLESITVGVRHIDAALGVFRDALGLRVESDRRASVSLLSAWHYPVHADVRLVELSGDGHGFGRVRLAQFDPPPAHATRLDAGAGAPDRPTDVGPKALDFYTGSPVEKGLAVLERAGCARRTDPTRYRVEAVEVEEVIVNGPDGVPLLLMVGHSQDPRLMRQAVAAGQFSEIATVSVVTADLEASRRFYGECLGLLSDFDAEVPPEFRDPVCRLTGIPPATRIHFIAYRDSEQPSGKFLLVHFFDATGAQLAHPMAPGQLGISLFSLRCDDLDTLETRVREMQFEIVTRPTHVALGDGAPARVMLARGPNNELLELVERND